MHKGINFNLFAPYISAAAKGVMSRITAGGKRHSMACPSHPGVPGVDVFTMAINYHSFDYSDATSYKKTSVHFSKRPSISLYFSEPVDATAAASNGKVALWGPTIRNIAYRHSKRANVLFCDGHVSPLQRSQIPNASTYYLNLDNTLFWWHSAKSAADTSTN